MEEEKPDFVLMGSSAHSKTDKNLIFEAKYKSIPCVSILDTYGRYVQRVSGRKGIEKFMFMPDKICIMDNIALEEMVKLGFNKEKLVITGQSFFDNLGKLRLKHTLQDSIGTRNELGINQEDYLILFSSQHIGALAKEKPESYQGYTEVTVLRSLYENLRQLKMKNLALLIKVHPDPREYIENTKKAIENPALEHKIIFLKDRKSRQHMLASDLVTGMYSTSLIETTHLNKPAISIQPNLNGTDNLPTNNVNVTIPVYKEEDILPTLEKVIFDKEYKEKLQEIRRRFFTDGKATERIVNLVYEMLNINSN